MTEINKDRENLVLGCLLHDIGKIIYRSKESSDGKYHQELGYNWLIEKFSDVSDRGLLANIALTHHAVRDEELNIFSDHNKSNFTLIAYEADNLSAKERKEYNPDNESSRWMKNVPLYSVFSKVSLKHKEDPVYNNCFKAYEMKEIDKNINFPREDIIISTETYKDLFDKFSKEFRKIKYNLTVDNLLILLEKYFSYVPSLTLVIYDKQGNPIEEKYPDISFYDHCKGSAAIACAMFNYFYENEKYTDKFLKADLLENEILDINEYKYLLVGCDISGVQNFIYTISSSEALKSLRARSFYLELLAEHIADEILEKLNLYRTNIIYIGGGGFYLLAQNTEKAKSEILAVKEEINNWLLKEFEGKLFTSIEYVELKGEDFYLNTDSNYYNIQNAWYGLSEKIEKSKKQKFINNLKDIIKIEKPFELTESCNICHTDNQELLSVDNVRYCSTCKTLSILGEKIKNKNLKYIAKSNLQIIIDDSSIETNCVRFTISNKQYILCDKTTLDKIPKEKYYVINNWDIDEFIEGNAIPLHIGNYYYEYALDFEKLADSSEGINRIGVLRMDVDNLGSIFSQGIHKSEATFSRLTSLSRNLSLFFKFYINEILSGNIDNQKSITNTTNTIKRKAVIIYSGGDDLFIVGSWNDIAELAIDINNCFKKYVGDNDDITLSAGFTIHDHNYPLYQMAKLSKRAEKSAKDNKYKLNGKNLKKNSISFFYDEALKIKNQVLKGNSSLKNDEYKISIAVNWEHFSKLFEHTKILYNIFDKLPHSDFIKLNRLIREWQCNGKFYLPLMNYILSKIRKKLGIDNEYFNIFSSIFTQYFKKPELISSLHIPLYWVEYLKRKQK